MVCDWRKMAKNSLFFSYVAFYSEMTLLKHDCFIFLLSIYEGRVLGGQEALLRCLELSCVHIR